ncbi:MAG: hypothetical protein IJD58_13740 [Lachnospiraceae bacterium]|nr:hypothetical protein [Lachnospiraceae bacterium]
MKYTEDFYNLSHGTDVESARDICLNGFEIRGDATSWCGKGVYFYDMKSKAWWAANRKCEEIKQQKQIKVEPIIILSDIINIYKDDIFDLRAKNDLEQFETFVKEVLSEGAELKVSGITDDTERKILLRSMLISFYADKIKCKLVIGNFRQRPQPLYEHSIEFANSLDMIFGIETIYCVKDVSIISNVRLGGNR